MAKIHDLFSDRINLSEKRRKSIYRFKKKISEKMDFEALLYKIHYDFNQKCRELDTKISSEFASKDKKYVKEKLNSHIEAAKYLDKITNKKE